MHECDKQFKFMSKYTSQRYANEANSLTLVISVTVLMGDILWGLCNLCMESWMQPNTMMDIMGV